MIKMPLEIWDWEKTAQIPAPWKIGLNPMRRCKLTRKCQLWTYQRSMVLLAKRRHLDCKQFWIETSTRWPCLLTTIIRKFPTYKSKNLSRNSRNRIKWTLSSHHQTRCTKSKICQPLTLNLIWHCIRLILTQVVNNHNNQNWRKNDLEF